MRLLMIQARVVLTGGGRVPASVGWAAPGSPSPTRKVISVIDEWRYDGHWWKPLELNRHYYLLELAGGTQLELFQEGDTWWAARASD